MCSGKGKISGNVFSESMNISMFDIFVPSLKTRKQLEERVDLSKFDRDSERYVFCFFLVTRGISNNDSIVLA